MRNHMLHCPSVYMRMCLTRLNIDIFGLVSWADNLSMGKSYHASINLV